MVDQSNDRVSRQTDAQSGTEGTTRYMPAPHERPTIASGTLLNHTYRVIELIGRGGMGEVYRARNDATDHDVAIKVICAERANDPKFSEMFRREAEVLRRVPHDAIVDYEGVFRDEHGCLYLVMEYVSGPSLSKVIAQRKLSPADILKLRNRLVDGLAAAHERGVIHRDLSPENIILPDGQLDKAKIIDFGIAKFTDATHSTLVGDAIAGKFPYMSPEQLGLFGGKVDERSDIYSLGLVLAAAAVRPPLEMGTSVATALEARRQVPDLRNAPAELRGQLEGMLKPDPRDRPQTMRDLLPLNPPPVPGPDSKREWRWFTAMAVMGLACIGVVGLISWIWSSPSEDEVQKAVSQVLAGFTCSGLQTALSPIRPDGFRVGLSGYVGSDGDLRLLTDRVSGVEHVREVVNNATVQPRPFCEVLGLLQAGGGLQVGGRGAPRIEPSHEDGRYFEGDSLIVSVKAAQPSGGYLHVDYYDTENNVVHLLPEPLRPDNRTVPGQQIVLGTAREVAGPDDRVFDVLPPFGRGMLVAISSSQQLFNEPRDVMEAADHYLDVLRSRLADLPPQKGTQHLMAAYTFISTAQSAQDQ